MTTRKGYDKDGNEGGHDKENVNSELLDPLLHPLLQCRVCVHEGLFVDDNLGRVRLWSAHS